MCGIAGYVADSSIEDRSLLQRMCDTIRHRGPDGSGYYQHGPVALGHRRLSIIDLSGGAQPLGNEDGSVQIVFNGEIYNYLELRADLLKKGHRFATNSDTEVIVHLYEEEGERAPEYLNGMFAFAIWDSRKESLLLARDRLGKKPLYYSTAAPGFRICFASELKALLATPGLAAVPRPDSIANALSLGYIPDPDTIYAGIHKLPPAHTATLNREGLSIRRYWAPQFAPDETLDYAGSMEELRELCADAVRGRMISDVPLGGFLSGGVDSGAVLAMMAQQAHGRVKSFSIGFTQREFDELQYARLVAERYRTDHYEEVVNSSIYEALPTIAEHYDEPFGDSSAVPTLNLSRMTRRHVTVALSGDGADELLGGYRRYRSVLREQRMAQRLPAWLRRTAIAAAARRYPLSGGVASVLPAKPALESLSHELGEAYFEAMTGFRYGLLGEILAPELRRKLGGFTPRESFVARFSKYRDLPPLQQLQAIDLETYLPGDILVKVDRASMAYSLEARCPWLDYRISNLAGRFPAHFKLHNGIGKRIFKDMLRPLLPEEILDRPKMGFGVPMDEWFRDTLKPVFQSLVLRPELAEYFFMPKLREVWEDHQSGRRNYGRELWSLLIFGCWEDRWLGAGGKLLEEALAVSGRR